MSITIPDNAPFTRSQKMWLKGFLDGLTASGSAAPSQAMTPAGDPVTILWGSQTGTAEALARQLAKRLGTTHSVTLRGMADIPAAELAGCGTILLITSTYGDGEPPDNAAALHAAVHGEDFDLTSLRFAVFALGDSNYPEFCKCGHDFHHRFTALGATPLLPLRESDVDHDASFAEWSASLVVSLTADLQ